MLQIEAADPAVRNDAIVALLCAALPQPLAALAYVYDGVILGLGDYTAMRRAMILAIFAFRRSRSRSPLPLARPARRMGCPRLLAGRPLGPAWPALGPGYQLAQHRQHPPVLPPTPAASGRDLVAIRACFAPAGRHCIAPGHI